MRKFIALLVLFCLPLFALADMTATFKVGDPATMSVTVDPLATAPFVYQWRKDGVAIDGATSATYRIAALKQSDAGAYTVTVSNLYGDVVSDKGFLVSGVAPRTATISITKL